MVFKIDSAAAGKTVLAFLKSTLKISGAALSKLKRDEKGIMANGNHVTVRYTLCEGDILSINETDLPDEQSEHIDPVDIPINIIFENDDIMIIDKPPYMPTHPSHGHTDDTLANAVAYKYLERKIPFVFRPIGRLDRNTSGISLVAKHAISSSFLEYARRNKMFGKSYIAILCGKLESDGWQTIETYMKRKENSVIIRCVSEDNAEGAFTAVTKWRSLYSSDQISVVEAIPITGRTHQLRVHFSHIGHALLGDDIYGEECPYISRHALHAFRLSIPIPYGETVETFISPPPDDMKKAFNDLTSLSLDEIFLQTIKTYKGGQD